MMTATWRGSGRDRTLASSSVVGVGSGTGGV